jgi:hypothetical protein
MNIRREQEEVEEMETRSKSEKENLQEINKEII